MRRSSRLVMFAVPFLAMLGHAYAVSAQTPKPEPTHRDVLLRHWTEIGDKVVKMAEEFPEDKYEFKPVPAVRTFADNLRHVAFWNTYVSATVKGEKIDPKINELPKAQYATKAAIVKALKSSLDEATGLLKNGPTAPSAKLTDLWTSFIEHSGEHYGQLVVYYRLNGIVPPASRGGN
jgi:DinB family protein